MPNIKKSEAKLTAIDLFSGCGGLTLGLKQAGFKVLGAVELDEAAARTYAYNHPEVCLENFDIRELSPKSFLKKLGLRPGELDVLASCPPCQGFSNLRTRNGALRNRDRRNDLVKQIIRFVDVLRPKSIMIENVPKLANYKPFKRLCMDLNDRGYMVSHGVKNAADFGVPQRRRRLILLAGKGVLIPFADKAGLSKTVRDVIGALCEPSASDDDLHKLPEKRSARIQKLISEIPKDGGSRSALPKHRQLECHKKSDGFKDIYGRMAWDNVAPTITSGCSNPSKGRFLHPEFDRTITMREAAMLQGFPPDYKFDIAAGKQAIALMIGNALPPEFIRRHALEIKRALSR